MSPTSYLAAPPRNTLRLDCQSASCDAFPYRHNQLIWFLRSGGTEIKDDLCLEDTSCDWLPWRIPPTE